MFLVVAPCFALNGCGDDDGTEPELITLADFAGSWTAQTYRITNAAQLAPTLAIIGFGATFEWTVDNSGNFAGNVFEPTVLAGQDPDLNFQGRFTLVGQDSLIINFVPEIPPFLTQTRAWFEFTGDNTLTLVDRNTTFDFHRDDNREAAIFEGTLVRNGNISAASRLR